ncbi:MAG TPA: O-antigen ligase family protein [Longimicrobiaceae bacterium]
MLTIKSREQLLPQFILGGCVALAALYGVVVADHGTDALLLLAGGAAVLVIMIWPTIGLLLLAATIPLENLLMVGEGFTATRLLGILVCGAWFVQKIVHRESFASLLSSSYFVMGGLFVLLVVSSITWAHNPLIARSGAISLVQAFALGMIIIDLAGSWRRMDSLIRVLILSAGVASTMTLTQALIGGLRRGGDDIAGGVNGTAVVLLTLLPFCFYLLRSHTTSVWRVLGIAVAAASVVAIIVTYSRMNLMLLVPVLLAQYWFVFRGRQGRAWLGVLTVAGLVGTLLWVPWDRVAQRIQTIGPYMESTLSQDGGTYSGRGYHMRVGLAIARDHPLFGVGYNNYGELFLREYQYTVAGSDRIYTNRRSPHSSLIGILADLGAVGILTWVLLIGAAIRGVLRAWYSTQGATERDRHYLVQALTLALLLHAIPYGFYLPNQKEKIFWVLIAMSTVVDRLARADRATLAPSRS